MNNLKTLSNSALLEKTRLLVSREREVTTELLWHLREVEVRRLHIEQGYSSLFDYVTRGLCYCEASAARRIAAMRLLKELPEIEPVLKSGELSLSNASALSHFFKKEEKPYSATEKRELVKEVTGKSRRQCEALLAERSPETPKRDQTRLISATHTEVRFTMDAQLLAKLDKLRSLLSHRNANPSYAELFEILADMALKRLNPEAKKSETPPAEQKAPTPPANPQRKRTISQPLRRLVWNRDQGRCTYVNAHSGTRCESRHFLEFHHIQDYSQGGAHTADNLTLRCRAHNLHAAVQSLGLPLMNAYLRR